MKNASYNLFVIWCYLVKFFLRREQTLDKKYPGLFKHHSSRQNSSSNSMDKLIKKRNVPQKLPSGKRCERFIVNYKNMITVSFVDHCF